MIVVREEKVTRGEFKPDDTVLAVFDGNTVFGSIFNEGKPVGVILFVDEERKDAFHANIKDKVATARIFGIIIGIALMMLLNYIVLSI